MNKLLATTFFILLAFLHRYTFAMPPKEEKEERRLSFKPGFQTQIQYSFKAPDEAKFPVTFDDFKKMVTRTNIFVDKTMFIK